MRAIVTLLVLAAAGCSSGVRESDPHPAGPRDMGYDRMIVPGSRIGPVVMLGTVQSAVNHLGEPDRVHRSDFRGPGYDADEVWYYYDDECISFTWMDKGVAPVIENGYRGINVTCDIWKTAEGLHVGSTVAEVVRAYPSHCTTNDEDGLFIGTTLGVWFRARDRNSPIRMISVVPPEYDLSNLCRS